MRRGFIPVFARAIEGWLGAVFGGFGIAAFPIARLGMVFGFIPLATFIGFGIAAFPRTWLGMAFAD
jgi:hypothetical protein